jgi:hypothetical protein
MTRSPATDNERPNEHCTYTYVFLFVVYTYPTFYMSWEYLFSAAYSKHSSMLLDLLHQNITFNEFDLSCFTSSIFDCETNLISAFNSA